MDYEYKLTTHGRAAIAACLALETPLRITRVGFGSGMIDEGKELADQHELLNFVSDGAITERRHEDDRLFLTLQFANQQHPDVKTFLLSEFMLYITDPVTGKETDLLYATLGDYPQPVPAYNPKYPSCVFNFPLILILSNEINASVLAPVGIVTYSDLNAVIDVIAIRRLDVTIPVSGWASGTAPGYAVQCDIPVPSAAERMIPFLTVLPVGAASADACGLAPFTETREGVLRVFARKAPTTAIPASLALAGDASGFCVVGSEDTYVLPPATTDTLGGVKVGGGVDVEDDGTISVDGARIVESAAASEESARLLLDEVFGTP